LIIRTLTADDADAFRSFRIAALRESPLSFGASADDEEQLSAEEWRNRLSAGRGNVYGCVASEGSLVGTVGVYIAEHGDAGDGPWLWTMYVAPEHRGRGIGRRLIERAVRELRAHGETRPLRLRVTHASPHARALYLGVGFSSVGCETNVPWHSGQTVDVETMSLPLGGPA
jgi:GNAT superfamily N-acetyltransferase